MLISETLAEKMNEQITHEFGASQTYLSMACMFEQMGLTNLAKFFRRQSDEERGHGLKFMDFLLDAGADVKLEAVPAPRASWDSPLAALEAALEHEKRVTAQINALVDIARENRDHNADKLLQWFTDEQVEEVSTMDRLVQLAKMAGTNLLQLDLCVGARESD